MNGFRTNELAAMGENRVCNGGFGPHRSVGRLALQPIAIESGAMLCRTGCGACCIAPSISSPIPGMPHGKPAGIPCVQLLPDYRCALFGRSERPAVCVSLRPTPEMCGADREEANAMLLALEKATAPAITFPFRMAAGVAENRAG